MNALRFSGWLLTGAALIGVAGCDRADARLSGPATGFDPSGLVGSYIWSFEGWDNGAPVGHPQVELSWRLPARWEVDDVFRIYARRASGRSFQLIATVTNCTAQLCQYSDINVAHGRSYDYFVVTYDGHARREVGSSRDVRVDVPPLPAMQTPQAPRAVALDNAVFLDWTPTGAQRYLVLAQPEGSGSFLIGETDGASFLDDRAENGLPHTYSVAGVDVDGHVSALSAGGLAIPRPDYHAELIRVHADLPSASGFRFVPTAAQDPIVPGDAPEAEWRLEADGDQLRIVPLQGVGITSGEFTTALTCGAGADPDCVDVATAPADHAFGTQPVPVSAAHTYVLRLPRAGQLHFGKLRVHGATVDGEGRRVLVFDWAFQLRPGERRLAVTGNW